MPLDDQLGRWTQHTAYVRDTLDPILSTLPSLDQVASSTFGLLQMMVDDQLLAGVGDAPPENSALADGLRRPGQRRQCAAHRGV